MKQMPSSPETGAPTAPTARAEGRKARSARKTAFATILLITLALSGCATAKARPEPAREPLGLKEQADSKERTKPDSEFVGTVAARVEAKGTLSEYTVFVLEQANSAELVLFNSKGYSAGFGVWVGKKVTVTGARAEGRIGNAHKRAMGVRVEAIAETP